MMMRPSRPPLRRVLTRLLAGLAAGALAAPLAAQVPVVQALPSPARAALASALQRLARSPSDFDALIAAGKASLDLGDIDAATGFFGRADVIRPGDARVKSGLAVASLKAGDPVAALRLFDQAQAAGAPPVTLAAERGLAFDLVGDNASAQAQYRLALAQGANDEVTRRLGLSQAIGGNAKAFEATLLPLLQRKDLAAFRARAFGLAIMGNEKEAMSIVSVVMPAALAKQIGPYLEYMPRLTRAQQAAAANLGAFPRAAQIGRDDPRLAQYTGAATPAPTTSTPVRTADARLAPAGAPLGPRIVAPTVSAAERRRIAAAERRAERSRPSPAPTPAPAPVTTRPVVQPTPAPAPVLAASTPARSSGELPAIGNTPRPVIVAQAPPPAAPAPTPAPAPRPTIALPGPTPAVTIPVNLRPALTSTPAPVTATAITPKPGPAPAPVTLAAVTPAPAPASSAPVVVQRIDLAPATPSTPAPTMQSEPPAPVSLAQAFADFDLSGGRATPAAGAVDITAITVKREVPQAAAPPPPPPAAKAAKAPPPAPKEKPKPKAPSRVWLQVATGKDVKALAFDWRKFTKKAPAVLGKRDAYTAKWGESRRLLTGPFASAKDANKALADLKKAGLDGFLFTSDEGEEVAPLQ